MGRGCGRGRQEFNKATVECYKCHKLGHFKNECPTWEANYVQLDEKEEMLLMSYVDSVEGKIDLVLRLRLFKPHEWGSL